MKIKLTKEEYQARRIGGVYFAYPKENLMWETTKTPQTKEEAQLLAGYDLCEIDLNGWVVEGEVLGESVKGLAVVHLKPLEQHLQTNEVEVEVIATGQLFNQQFKKRYDELCLNHYVLDLSLIFE